MTSKAINLIKCLFFIKKKNCHTATIITNNNIEWMTMDINSFLNNKENLLGFDTPFFPLRFRVLNHHCHRLAEVVYVCI